MAVVKDFRTETRGNLARLAPHVRQAIAAGMQAKLATPPAQQRVAPHVQAAIATAAQPKLEQPHAAQQKVPAHVQPAVAWQNRPNSPVQQTSLRLAAAPGVSAKTILEPGKEPSDALQLKRLPPPRTATASSVIQREIGDRGADLVGKYVRTEDGFMGMIDMFHPETGVYQIATDGEDAFAVGSDPYWRVVDDFSGEYLWHEARRLRPKMATLVSNHLQEENVLPYEERGGLLYGLDGELLNPRGFDREKGVVSFVLTRNFDLLLGSGHTGLSRGHAVVAAGTLRIKDGRAMYKANESGHYMPEGLTEVRGIKYLKRYYPWISFPRGNVGVWFLEGNLNQQRKEQARNQMVKILLEQDKETRRRRKQALAQILS